MKLLIQTLITLLALTYIQGQVSADDDSDKITVKEILAVYKSPTCGCCKSWMAHLKTNGIETTAHHPDSMSAVKNEKGIDSRYWSCHTAVSKDGYVFEGHIPAKFIHQFLASPPKDAIGLSVPSMPVGSPGMEYQDKFMPYKVLLLNKDGSSTVYADIQSPKDQ